MGFPGSKYSSSSNSGIGVTKSIKGMFSTDSGTLSKRSKAGEDSIELSDVQVSSELYDHAESEEGEGDFHETEVKRALKPRHVSMIALGGTIGTGLFVGIAKPLSLSGPVGSLIAYIFMGSVVYFVTQSLGEMATFIPVTSSITVFSKRFLSPAFGVCLLYTSRCV